MNSQNIVNLIFLDTLMVDIQETDLNLTMNNQNIDYTLTKIDINTWQISPKYIIPVKKLHKSSLA